MDRDRFTEITDILHLGLEEQNRLAELNRVVTDRIRTAEHEAVHGLFEELLAIAGETDIKKMAQKEERLDGLDSDLSGQRIGLLKELELLRAMRQTNEVYIDSLQRAVDEGLAYCETSPAGALPDLADRQQIMQKRVQELMTTKSVGISFSAQIRLAEDNLSSLAGRILDVQVNLIPLLRGRLSLEHSRILTEEIRKRMGTE